MAPLGQKYWNKVRKNPHFQLFSLIYYIWNQTVPYESNREVKMSLRWQQRKRQKSDRFRLAKRQLRTCTKFFCPFLCRQARLWHELPNFTFHRQREHATTHFSFHPQLSLTQIGFVCASQYAQKVITLSMFGRRHCHSWRNQAPKILSPFPLPILPLVL